MAQKRKEDKRPSQDETNNQNHPETESHYNEYGLDETDEIMDSPRERKTAREYDKNYRDEGFSSSSQSNDDPYAREREQNPEPDDYDPNKTNFPRERKTSKEYRNPDFADGEKTNNQAHTHNRNKNSDDDSLEHRQKNQENNE
jgi:hypothetical protein